MTTKSTRRCGTKLILATLILTPLKVSAQPTEDAPSSATLPPPSEKRQFSRSEVYAYTGSSLAFQAGWVGSIAFVSKEELNALRPPWWVFAIAGGEHLPLYLLNPQRAAAFTATEAAFLGTHLATRDQGLDINLISVNGYVNTASYSTYEIYKHTREGVVPGAYGKSDWKAEELPDLLSAPVSWQHMSDPWVWGTLTFAAVTTALDARGSETSIWNKGDAYIGNHKMSPAVAIPAMFGMAGLAFLATAVGEESVYRGVLYEETSYEWGTWPGRAADMVLFPSIHVAGDLRRGETTSKATEQFVARAVSTLIFDILYDRGGIGRSVALHTWINTVPFLISWAKEAGVPESERERNQDPLEQMTLNLSLSF